MLSANSLGEISVICTNFICLIKSAQYVHEYISGSQGPGRNNPVVNCIHMTLIAPINLCTSSCSLNTR